MCAKFTCGKDHSEVLGAKQNLDQLPVWSRQPSVMNLHKHRKGLSAPRSLPEQDQNLHSNCNPLIMIAARRPVELAWHLPMQRFNPVYCTAAHDTGQLACLLLSVQVSTHPTSNRQWKCSCFLLPLSVPNLVLCFVPLLKTQKRCASGNPVNMPNCHRSCRAHTNTCFRAAHSITSSPAGPFQSTFVLLPLRQMATTSCKAARPEVNPEHPTQPCQLRQEGSFTPMPRFRHLHSTCDSS